MQNKPRDIAQVVDCLPRKHEALSSNPSNAKKGLDILDIYTLTHFVFYIICTRVVLNS
jgi:hypothetical protein